jgi:pimeloyl-ACP methyl ester carboxylesterase
MGGIITCPARSPPTIFASGSARTESKRDRNVRVEPGGRQPALATGGAPATGLAVLSLVTVMANIHGMAAGFAYTFDALTDLTTGLLTHLGIDRYAVYVQDYGAPIGWRLALRDPAAITAIVTQNGNAYEAGFVESFWSGVFAYQQDPNETTEAGARQALTLDAIRWQYLTGTSDETLVNPSAWEHDHALVSRPGNDRVQLALFSDYATNRPLYPVVHEYFRTSQVPLLAVWGRGDEIFGPDGARAFADDLPKAEIHLLDGGHFLLESAVGEVAALIRPFLAEVTRG